MSTLSQLAHLADDQRLAVIGWLDDFERIAASANKTAAVTAIARERGVCTASVYNKLKAYREHGAAGLVDGRSRSAKRSHHGAPQNAAYIAGRPDDPAAWQKHVHDKFGDYQRSRCAVTVWEALLGEWRLWRAEPWNVERQIPGWRTCPPPCAASGDLHPAGWSLRNIQRMAPDKFARALSRQGRAKARELLPPVLTTRVGTLPGQIYMLDDQHNNVMVHFGGKMVRPLSLHALDLHSGMDIARYFRPRLPDLPAGQKEITERETLWFVLHLLTNHGWRNDTGTVIIVEAAKATLRDRAAAAIVDVTGGKVQVHRKPVTGDALRYFGGPARGNPRDKAARESWFNLFQNRMGVLPGQIGAHPEDAPEEMKAHGSSSLVRYHQKVIDEAIARLSIEDIMQLKLELLPWNRFVHLANTIAEAVNDRRNHKLEGYKALGYEQIEYRLPNGEWVHENDFLALPDHTRNQVSARLHDGHPDYRHSLLSPRQVWDAGTRNAPMGHLRPDQWHLILPSHFGLRRTIPAKRQIQVSDAEFSPEPMIFNHTARALDGSRRVMRPGEEVILHINPWRPDCALALTTDGQPIGILPRVWPESRLNSEALIRQYAERNELVAEIGANALEHAAEIARARDAMVRRNDGLLRKKPAPDTRAEAAAARLRDRAPSVDPTDDDDDDETDAPLVLATDLPPTFPDDDETDDLADIL